MTTENGILQPNAKYRFSIFILENQFVRMLSKCKGLIGTVIYFNPSRK